MIRTSIIMSPRQEAADRLYFHANGMQIDVSTASQLIVRTSHRPAQIYSATRSGIRHQAPNLTSQTGFQGQRWQRLMDIFDRQGSDTLPGLFNDGELTGEWIVALDERHLNALLSDRFAFYLYRNDVLHELRPVSQLTQADQVNAMNHYRILVYQNDQIMILPSDLLQPTLLPEAEQILSGIQQLPVRLSALGARLRERGVTVPFNGWMALHVLRAEPEYMIQEHSLKLWLAGRRKPVIDGKGPGFSDSMIEEQTAAGKSESATDSRDTDAGGRGGEFVRMAPRIAMIVVALIVAAALMTLLFQTVFPKSEETTRTTSTITSTTMARPTPTVTVTPRPTTTATTTVALPQWYVIARRLNLRSDPSVSSTLIRTLTTGQIVFIIEQTNAEWTQVRTPEGETGYVYAAYISKDKPAG